MPQGFIPPEDFPLAPPLAEAQDRPKEDQLYLAGGCFWCVEAVFAQLDANLQLVSGYCGGTAATATYEQVCRGQTQHAETLQITFVPDQISREALLRVFFSLAHDPTQWQRQGADRGPQYRSAIFYRNTAEEQQLRAYIDQLNALPAFAQPIVTQLEPFAGFFPAEIEHQGYAARHPQQPYIQAVAQPKVEAVRAFLQRQ